MNTLLKKITPVGKLVKLENISLVADISSRAGSWDINELYHPTGIKVEEGDPVGEDGKVFNTKLYDRIYNELDQENFFEIKTPQELFKNNNPKSQSQSLEIN